MRFLGGFGLGGSLGVWKVFWWLGFVGLVDGGCSGYIVLCGWILFVFLV